MWILRTPWLPGRIAGARARRWASTLVLAVLLSCRGEGDAPPEEAVEREIAAAEAAIDDWPCEEQGYPCTWEEVSAETTERTFALADQALDRFEAGKAAELVAWLLAQPGVVEAGEEDPTIVWFRLEGGRIARIEGPLPPTPLEQAMSMGIGPKSRGPDLDIRTASTGSGIRIGWDLLTSWNSPKESAEPTVSSWVTGRDRNEDKRVNQRDQRRALILESMNWEDCYEAYAPQDRREEQKQRRQIEAKCKEGDYKSVGDRIASTLERSPVYRGNVKVLKNQQVDFAAIAGWEAYDIIHIEGHGSRNTLCIGTDIQYPGRGKLRGAAAQRRGVNITWFRAGKVGPKKAVWCVDRRFMKSRYPKGLERTLIFVNACSTLGDPAGSSPPLPTQLLGAGSMYVGWGGVTDQWSKIDEFYYWVRDGYTGSEAIKRLGGRLAGGYGKEIVAQDCATSISPDVSDGDLALVQGMTLEEFREAGGREGMAERWEKTCVEDQRKTGEILGWRGSDIRIREVVKLFHPPVLSIPNQLPLEDGDDLEAIVVGELDDGEEDYLRVTVEVESITEMEPYAVSVQLELDGVPLDAPELVTERDFFRPGPDYRKNLDKVPVRMDLEADREYELEAVVQLPEGGESRYAVKLKAEPCPVYIQGEFEGQLGGGHAQVFERGRDTQAKIFLHDRGGGIPGFRLPQQFHLEQRGGGRNGWAFNFNAVLDGPVVPGARFRVERSDLMDPSNQVSGSYRESKGEDAMQYPLGSANIVIHRVRWLDIDEGSDRRGMACGEVEANLQGLVPETYPFQFVPHTFRATFWAEIRRD